MTPAEIRETHGLVGHLEAQVDGAAILVKTADGREMRVTGSHGLPTEILSMIAWWNGAPELADQLEAPKARAKKVE